MYFSFSFNKFYIFCLICFFSISTKAQIFEVDKFRNCKTQYEQINKYINSLENLRRDIAPISAAKSNYLSSLRFKALNGTIDERKDSSPKFYGDEDYVNFNLNLILGFAIRDLKEFTDKRNWNDDRLSMLELVQKGSDFNFYSNNNPFSFFSNQVKLSREMSILAHNINISLLEIKSKNQSHKIRHIDFYLATGNDGHWPMSNLLDCQINYLADAWRYHSDGIANQKK